MLKGQGTDTITVKWGTRSGNIKVTPVNECAKGRSRSLTVYVSNGNIAAVTQNNNNVSVNSNRLVLYPQPAFNEATLRVYIKQAGVYVININDMSGKTINLIVKRLMPGYTDIKLNTNRLSNGIYYIRISGDNYNDRIKMIKE